jgi:arylamine N-acetyltransferase
MAESWSRVHLINIITFPNGSRWTCDVAFGGDGPTEPIELRDGAAIKNLGSQDARLIRDWIPSQTERSEATKFWIYQYRNRPEQPWNAFYGFHEGVEWSQADYEITNWYTGHNPYSFQTYTVIVVKFLRRRKEGAAEDDDNAEEVYGKRLLVNEAVKENLGGKTQVPLLCQTEEQRVKALKEWFKIELTEEQAVSIKGFQTEIK